MAQLVDAGNREPVLPEYGRGMSGSSRLALVQKREHRADDLVGHGGFGAAHRGASSHGCLVVFMRNLSVWVAGAPTVRSYLGHATESETVKLPLNCTNCGARYWD